MPVFERRDLGSGLPRRLLDPVAAWHVGNILLGTPPPESVLGGRIAFKTGTSYGRSRCLGDRIRRSEGFKSAGQTARRSWGLSGAMPQPPPVRGVRPRGPPAAPLRPAPRARLIASTARLPPPLQQFRWPGPRGQHGDPCGSCSRPTVSAWSASQVRVPLALRVSGGLAPLTGPRQRRCVGRCRAGCA